MFSCFFACLFGRLKQNQGRVRSGWAAPLKDLSHRGSLLQAAGRDERNMVKITNQFSVAVPLVVQPSNHYCFYYH